MVNNSVTASIIGAAMSNARLATRFFRFTAVDRYQDVGLIRRQQSIAILNVYTFQLMLTDLHNTLHLAHMLRLRCYSLL